MIYVNGSYSYSRVMPVWPGFCKNSPVSQGQKFEDTSRKISAPKKTVFSFGNIKPLNYAFHAIPDPD